MIVKLYRKYLSESTREKIYKLFLGRLLFNLRNVPTRLKGLWVYTFSYFYPKNEYYDAYRFIGKHGITLYPFESSLKYKAIQIDVLYDDSESLPYVMHTDKKLFFPRHLNNEIISSIYRSLLLEQDPDSSHRYINEYSELQDKVLLDIGAAEGFFALETITYIKKAYLFECEDVWIEALNATFKPWKEKVEIIKKYVSDKDNDNCITIDSFMKEREQENIHLKMDIEGAEQEALRGCENLLKKGRNISYSVCTYHKLEDAEVIRSFFSSLGYSTEFSKGYFYLQPKIRKAICRGEN